MAKAKLGCVLVLVSCCFAVVASGQLTYPQDALALKAIRTKLIDSRKNLGNWRKGDPCASKWTGVICTKEDGYLRVQELRMLNLNLSGTLAPELGNLSSLLILNFNWNQDITGSIPKEIGNIKSLEALLLSGNKLSGNLPDELGYLPNLIVFQVDYNQISGSLPKSYVHLKSCVHFHMNDNSISGQIPSELYIMPSLQHFLLDNNNLSGSLPPEFSQMPKLTIIQLDNNNFGGTEIPSSYSSMSKLVKLSLRNCSLRGAIPDFSSIESLRYLDLSHNHHSGEIPTNKLSDKITTIDLSNNFLKGSIPSHFSGLPHLQRLSLQNNNLRGDVPSDVWSNVNPSTALILDFRNNFLTGISSSIEPPLNVTIRLEGNDVCNSANELNKTRFCGNTSGDHDFSPVSSNGPNTICQCHSKDGEEYVSGTPGPCFCAYPLGVYIRLKSPSISDFRPYKNNYTSLVTSSLSLEDYQLVVASFIWQEGPRLLLDLKFFPQYSNDTGKFTGSEVQRICDMIFNYSVVSNDDFGSYEVINLGLGTYEPYVKPEHLSSGISKGTLAGIVLGAMSLLFSICLAIVFIFFKSHTPCGHKVSIKESTSKPPIRTESVKELSYVELKVATNGFDDKSEVGRGGYGKVYRGVLANKTVVAIKRAQQGSLQGQTEFITEIELLSRLHHRNLVSLVGYCCENDEQMLVYEFMPNGSLHDHLSHKSRGTLSFPLRMRIALGAAKGILYLHSEAYPPIFHRDIKANNILLDIKFNAKVSDFGISKPAPDHAEGTSSQISTVVKGTPGYLDPEYFLTHKLTEKSDVYSLGIVFLELLTGKQPISHGKNIVREVSVACNSGMMFSIVDQNMGSYSSECVKKFMALALKCCQDDPKDRPTMLEVVREVESLCSKLPLSESPSVPTESDSMSTESSIPYSGRSSQLNIETSGSELVSGVIPTISPR